MNALKSGIAMNKYAASKNDDELLRIARTDLESGTDERIIDCYMSPRINIEQSKILAEAFRQGMSLSLGKKIIARDAGQVEEILIHVKERIPFDAIEQIVDENSSAKRIQSAFRQYKEHILNYLKEGDKKAKPEVEDDEPKVEETKPKAEKKQTKTVKNATLIKEKKAEEPENEVKETEPEVKNTESEPEPVKELEPEEKKSEPAEIQEEKAKKETKVDQSATTGDTHAGDGKDILVAVTSMADFMKDMNVRNMEFFDRILKSSEERSYAFLEKMQEESLEWRKAQERTHTTTVQPEMQPYPASIPVPWKSSPIPKEEIRIPDYVQNPTPEAKQTPDYATQMDVSVHQNEELPERALEYIRKITEPAAAQAQDKIQPQVQEQPKTQPKEQEVDEIPTFPESVDGVIHMIRMPDGSLHPLYVENQKRNKRRGLLGFTSKIFGKGSAQESLLDQLIQGGLNADQLLAIRRAVRHNLRPNEINSLINSKLTPDEMNNLVDVILTQRSQRMIVEVG